MKKLLLLALLGLTTLHAGVITLPTHLGPTDFDTSAFPNTLVGGSLSSTSLQFGAGVPIASGPFTLAQAIPLVTGSDISQGLALGAGPTGGVADFIVPGFGNISIINGPGADLVIFEAGSPAEGFLLAVSLNGGVTFSSSILFSTSAAVPANSASGFATNTAFVDLTDFGIGAGDKVDAIMLSGLFTGIGGSGPDILAIGVLNFGTPTGNVPGDGTSIPEPSTFALMFGGLAAVVWARRKRSAA